MNQHPSPFYLFVNHGPGRICRYNPDTHQVDTIVQLRQRFDPPDIAIAIRNAYGITGRNGQHFEGVDHVNQIHLENQIAPRIWHTGACVVYYNERLFYIGSYGNNGARVFVFDGVDWQFNREVSWFINEKSHTSLVHTDWFYVIDPDEMGVFCSDAVEWSQAVGHTIMPRYGAAVASFRGKIYITGGMTRITSFRANVGDHPIDEITAACETFENGRSIAEKATMIASLNHKRYFHALVVVKNRLFAIGGYRNVGGNDIPVDFCTEIEEYDVENNKWEDIGPPRNQNE
ncbi:hypothetical protein WR25_18860 [Diploscapter pachys]|uniref:Kelch repeat protein n=1 Tax=Diploscapter pachys TaxID=2018661 RepID=A0A2A2LUK6_9BILA|nr:hypothetical protein WR25_18860 [Diploscapter pachys]